MSTFKESIKKFVDGVIRYFDLNERGRKAHAPKPGFNCNIEVVDVDPKKVAVTKHLLENYKLEMEYEVTDSHVDENGRTIVDGIKVWGVSMVPRKE